ncbi:MAG: acetate--CoA ligase, partial [Actinomycetota bacterium]
MTSNAIDDLGSENRRFAPPANFVSTAHVRDQSLHEEARRDREAYWARHARELLDWVDPFRTVCEWDLPYSKWFVGGTLNVSYNCLDR